LFGGLVRGQVFRISQQPRSQQLPLISPAATCWPELRASFHIALRTVSVAKLNAPPYHPYLLKEQLVIWATGYRRSYSCRFDAVGMLLVLGAMGLVWSDGTSPPTLLRIGNASA
jgi:hypothetical protein